jgi:ABC-type branched-subunit amino acid transport system ATPase component
VAGSPPLLAVDGLACHFGGVRAVDGVSLEVQPGEVYGLIGPNGAGKTTLINLVTGLLRPNQGRVVFDGRDVTGWPPHRVARQGLARTYQHIRLFPAMSALENVVAGEHGQRRAPFWRHLFFLPGAAHEAVAARERAAALLAALGLEVYTPPGPGSQVPAGALSYGDRRRLEIARALASAPRLLLLDEPAAGMTHAETGRLVDLIRRLPREGHTVLLVEHNMRVVMEACDRIGVLDFGRLISEGTPAAVRDDPRVVEAYLGRDEDQA